jgi:cytosine/adenosine deaminase-related metal-dependent hydrolase
VGDRSVRGGSRGAVAFAEASERIGGQLFHNQQDTPIRGFIGLYGEGTDSPALYARAVEVARANDVVVQKHLGYQPAMYADAEKHLGCSPVRWLVEHDQLDEHSSFVHMNRLSKGDADLLASAGAACVWCPYGQLRVLSHPEAEPRMTELVRSRVPMGLGSDIARVINLDGLGSLAVAASTVTGNPVTAAEVLHMRTVGAATSIGATDVGALQAGYRADLVVRYPSATQDLGVDACVEAALLACRGTVRAVVVDGEVVVDDGVPTWLDAEQAVADARASVDSITRRLALS